MTSPMARTLTYAVFILDLLSLSTVLVIKSEFSQLGMFPKPPYLSTKAAQYECVTMGVSDS